MAGYLSRTNLIIIGSIALIFLISANIAWLNPNPEYVVKTHPTIPILWQYNGDSTVEFLSAAYFPQYYRIDKTRINRPGYPVVAHILGKTWGAISSPIYKMNDLMTGLLGYLTLKLIVYLSGAFTLYQIVKRWLPKEAALLSIPLVFFHPFSVLFSTTFHTSELQFISPFLLIYLWLNLSDSYSHKKNMIFSLLAGLLMLAKQNYAIYLAILVFSFFYHRRYKESILSFLVHLIPLGLWLLSLKLLSIPYYNHESANGLGVWLYQDLIFRNPLEILKVILGSVNLWLLAILGYFSVFAILALVAINKQEVKSKLNRGMGIFATIFLSLSWLQTFAANRYNSYMTADLSILIFPLAAFIIISIVDTFKLRKWLPVFLGLYLSLGLLTIVKFPWIPPSEHKNVIHTERVSDLKAGNL